MKQMPERRGRPEKEGKTTPLLGRSADIIANTLKVNVKAIQQAKALIHEAPDLVTKVEAQAENITNAYAQVQERKGVDASLPHHAYEPLPATCFPRQVALFISSRCHGPGGGSIE